MHQIAITMTLFDLCELRLSRITEVNCAPANV
jgi:hypothetical protein